MKQQLTSQWRRSRQEDNDEFYASNKYQAMLKKQLESYSGIHKPSGKKRKKGK
jgi:hypothetical protein